MDRRKYSRVRKQHTPRPLPDFGRPARVLEGVTLHEARRTVVMWSDTNCLPSAGN
jgi:hypothetical protein